MAPIAFALGTQFVAVELIKKSLTPLQVCLLRRRSPLKRTPLGDLLIRVIVMLWRMAINIVYCFYQKNDIARGFSPAYVLLMLPLTAAAARMRARTGFLHAHHTLPRRLECRSRNQAGSGCRARN